MIKRRTTAATAIKTTISSSTSTSTSYNIYNYNNNYYNSRTIMSNASTTSQGQGRSQFSRDLHVDQSEVVSLTGTGPTLGTASGTASLEEGLSSLSSSSSPSKPSSTSKSKAKKAHKKRSRICIILNYLTLSALAIILTISCKSTSLWDIESKSKLTSERGSININELKSLLIHYVSVLIFFYFVQGSNPGYLTSDVMNRVCDVDGLSMHGEELKSRNDNGSGNGSDNGNGSGNVEDDEELGNSLQVQDHQPMTSIEMMNLGNNNEITRRTNGNDNTTINNDYNDNTALKPPSDDNSNYNKINNNNNNNDNPNDNNNTNNLQIALHKKRRKVCEICNIAPTLRSHHCHYCSKCVATFDHHCHFIGTCIGERNHCRFYWFIVVQAIGFLKCVSIVNSTKFGFSSWMLHPVLFKNVNDVDIWIVIGTRVYLYFLTFSACLIVIVHTWFLLTNGTTFEHEKLQYLEYLQGTSVCDIPFSLGLWMNLKTFCCLRDDSSQYLSQGCQDTRCGQISSQSCPSANASTNPSTSLCCGNNNGGKKMKKKDHNQWTPIIWKPIGTNVYDSDDWRNNLWSNKYWTCC